MILGIELEIIRIGEVKLPGGITYAVVIIIT